MKKQSIPVGLNPDEILNYMHQHGFRNRHPSIGEHLGLVLTYYELVNKQLMEEK
jgi:hypothetical protein